MLELTDEQLDALTSEAETLVTMTAANYRDVVLGLIEKLDPLYEAYVREEVADEIDWDNAIESLLPHYWGLLLAGKINNAIGASRVRRLQKGLDW